MPAKSAQAMIPRPYGTCSFHFMWRVSRRGRPAIPHVLGAAAVLVEHLGAAVCAKHHREEHAGVGEQDVRIRITMRARPDLHRVRMVVRNPDQRVTGATGTRPVVKPDTELVRAVLDRWAHRSDEHQAAAAAVDGRVQQLAIEADRALVGKRTPHELNGLANGCRVEDHAGERARVGPPDHGHARYWCAVQEEPGRRAEHEGVAHQWRTWKGHLFARTTVTTVSPSRSCTQRPLVSESMIASARRIRRMARRSSMPDFAASRMLAMASRQSTKIARQSTNHCGALIGAQAALAVPYRACPADEAIKKR